MKTTKIKKGALLLAAIGGIALITPAYAGVHAGEGVKDQFTKMDSNNDGKISAEEHAAGAQAMFASMDANSDGKVTSMEMDAAQGKMSGKKGKHAAMSSSEKIKAMDTDGDGALTAAEHSAGAVTMFGKMDRDHDGFLSRKEMTKGHAKMMGKERA